MAVDSRQTADLDYKPSNHGPLTTTITTVQNVYVNVITNLRFRKKNGYLKCCCTELGKCCEKRDSKQIFKVNLVFLSCAVTRLEVFGDICVKKV